MDRDARVGVLRRLDTAQDGSTVERRAEEVVGRFSAVPAWMRVGKAIWTMSEGRVGANGIVGIVAEAGAASQARGGEKVSLGDGR